MVMSAAAKKTRFTKKRLEIVTEVAKEAGGRVRGNLRTGEFEIDFPTAGANDLSDADGEAQRLESAMDEQMAQGKAAPVRGG
jgi:hypothetical protein